MLREKFCNCTSISRQLNVLRRRRFEEQTTEQKHWKEKRCFDGSSHKIIIYHLSQLKLFFRWFFLSFCSFLPGAFHSLCVFSCLLFDDRKLHECDLFQTPCAPTKGEECDDGKKSAISWQLFLSFYFVSFLRVVRYCWTLLLFFHTFCDSLFDREKWECPCAPLQCERSDEFATSSFCCIQLLISERLSRMSIKIQCEWQRIFAYFLWFSCCCCCADDDDDDDDGNDVTLFLVQNEHFNLICWKDNFRINERLNWMKFNRIRRPEVITWHFDREERPNWTNERRTYNFFLDANTFPLKKNSYFELRLDKEKM